MAKYKKALLEKLAEETGMALGSIYAAIDRVEKATGAPASIAALLYAKQQKVAFKRLSTEEERTRMAEFARNGSGEVAPATQSSHRATRARSAPKKKPRNSKAVFLIHGRNISVNKSMHDFLRSIGLQPVEFSSAIHATIKKQKRGANPYLGDILDVNFESVKALIVLFTPDDEVRLRQSLWAKKESSVEKRFVPQARANVIFEAGLALGRHEEKTLFVSVGRSKVFSDIAGKHMLYLDNSTGKRRDFARRLEALGCQVDLTGDDWDTAGSFAIG